jgi:hypothetical protein
MIIQEYVSYSVSCFICGLSRLDLRHIILLNRTKFYKHLNKISTLSIAYFVVLPIIVMQDSLTQLPYGLLKICICNDFTRQTSCCFLSFASFDSAV